VVFFDQNTLAGDWRAQVRYCRENGIALYRDIAFALAVADLLELPDDLPLMPAVTAAMSIPICLGDPASLAYLKAVARSAGRRRAVRRVAKSAPPRHVALTTDVLAEIMVWVPPPIVGGGTFLLIICGRAAFPPIPLSGGC
jgi:hypothetical protein